MKKIVVLLAVILCAIFSQGGSICWAEETSSNESIEEELEGAVEDQLGDLDLSGFEEILAGLGENSFFEGSSFLEKLQKIISGEFAENSADIWSAIGDLIFEDLLDFLPMMAMIVAVAVLAGILGDMRSGKGNSSIYNIIHFVCFGIVIIIVASACTNMLTLTSNTLMSIKTQMEVAFPVLLTLLTAVGGGVSVSVYQPAVALLTGTITQIFTMLLMPLFIFSLVFSVVSNLTNSVKLEKFSHFFNSLFKWTIGAVFTIFMGFLVIQGLTAGSIDTISMRTAKFALKSYIPLLGGYLSDGINVIITSSVLIKNAVGACGLLLLFASILSPLVQIILFMLCLKLTAAILEPLADNRICSFVSSVAKSLTMPIVLIIGVSFMYFIFVGLVMCTGNFV